MKITRYEFCGEGLFNALDYLYGADMDREDAIEFSKVENIFENNLPTPHYISYDSSYGIPRFYFTEFGNKKFRKEINILVDLFDRYCSEFGTITKVTKSFDDNSSFKVIYKDRYQVLVQNNIF